MEPAKDATRTLGGQYLTFLVGGEEYGVAILSVLEIVEYGTVTRVPGTPPWIRGVMNLRGSVVPVVDLAVKMGLAASEAARLSCIVVVEVPLAGEPALLGMLVDTVRQVVELSPTDVEPPPPFGTRVCVEYLLGMGRVGDAFAMLLDIQRVLSAEELVASTGLANQGPAGLLRRGRALRRRSRDAAATGLASPLQAAFAALGVSGAPAPFGVNQPQHPSLRG